jgi:hypothetical protein
MDVEPAATDPVICGLAENRGNPFANTQIKYHQSSRVLVSSGGDGFVNSCPKFFFEGIQVQSRMALATEISEPPLSRTFSIRHSVLLTTQSGGQPKS